MVELVLVGRGGIKMTDLEKKKSLKETAIRDWTEKKIELAKDWIDNEPTQRTRRIVQRGIYLCILGENIGSEQNTELLERRPVLVLSNNIILPNDPNALIAPLTSKLETKTGRQGRTVPRFGSHYFLYKSKYTFLDENSAVMTEALRSVSKIRLVTKLGDIDELDYKRVIAKLKWTTGL